MSNTPPAWVVNAALPPVLNPENCVVPPLLVMTVALPAVLVLVNVVNPPLLVTTAALPAVLLLVNAKSELVGTKKLGAFEELLTMPAPVNVRVLAEVRVKE